VGDYRDDRAGLRQRVSDLEEELEGERKKARELERQLGAGKTHGPVSQRPESLGRAVLVVVGLALALCVVGTLINYAAGAAVTHTNEPWASEPEAVDATTERPLEWQLARSCRCPPAEGRTGFALVFAKFIPPRDFFNWSLRFDAAQGGQPHDVPLWIDDDETAPPEFLAGGAVQYRFACLPDRVVFAFDRQVTAWSVANGHALWTSPLPAPVESTRPSAPSVECRPLAVDSMLRISVPHERGSALLEGMDGSVLRAE